MSLQSFETVDFEMPDSPMACTRANQALHVGLHEHLQHRLGDATKEVAVSCFRQQVGEWQSVVGHRVLGRSGVGASQLHPSR